MSRKSDDDNRSNQLNPNNDAYYSSRGVSRGDYDDDDGDYYSPVSWADIAQRDAWRRHEVEMRTPVREEFTFDFMSMSGLSAHLKATAEMPNKYYQDAYFCDCTDLIDKILYHRLRTAFEKETRSSIAYSRVRDGQGKELFWLQEEFKPQEDSILYNQELKQKIAQQNELWEQSAKFKVENFKKKLQDYESIPREDIGFIITPKNFRQVSEIKGVGVIYFGAIKRN